MPRFADPQGHPVVVWLPKAGYSVKFTGGTYATESVPEIEDLRANRNIYELKPDMEKPPEVEELAVVEVPLAEDPSIKVTVTKRGPGRPRKV